MISFEDIKNDLSVQAYIKQSDLSLQAMGFTEHGFSHVTRTASVAKYILSSIGYSPRDIELCQIAGYLHDIGNLVNRSCHAHSGAIMAQRILDRLNMDPYETALISTAIGNHDEESAFPVNHISAALILADKTDVRRSRVRNTDTSNFDIHDRVNYSVKHSEVIVDSEKRTIKLRFSIDTAYCAVMDYFEIFLGRMILCRKAAEKLELRFKLVINGQELL